MLEFLRDRASDRKLRLFAVTCCHRIWDLLTEDCSRAAVHMAEGHTDRPVGDDALESVRIQAVATADRLIWIGCFDVGDAARAASQLPSRRFDVDLAAQVASKARSVKRFERGEKIIDEWVSQSEFIHCIFGNPFRPVAVDPRWRTSTVLALANGIHADRAFDRLPILADALEEAGCDSADVLAHCRGDGPHVRGCWVVDLLLGKE